MPGRRVQVPQDTASELLFLCDHTCCVCRVTGRPIQIHHLDEDPTNNAPDNLAPLCLDDHHRTQLSGGFARGLSADLLRRYRDDWLTRIAKRRDEADRIASQAQAAVAIDRTGEAEDPEPWIDEAPDPTLVSYINGLPSVMVNAFAAKQTQLDSGVTIALEDAAEYLTAIVVQILIKLSHWLPPENFPFNPERFFSEYLASRRVWCRALIGYTEGTIRGPATAFAVFDDMTHAVEDVVSCLVAGRKGFRLRAWRSAWTSAVNLRLN